MHAGRWRATDEPTLLDNAGKSGMTGDAAVDYSNPRPPCG
jgi:hypothetical protein